MVVLNKEIHQLKHDLEHYKKIGLKVQCNEGPEPEDNSFLK